MGYSQHFLSYLPVLISKHSALSQRVKFEEVGVHIALVAEYWALQEADVVQDAWLDSYHLFLVGIRQPVPEQG